MVSLFRETCIVFLPLLLLSNCKGFVCKIIQLSQGGFIEGDDMLFSTYVYFFPHNIH